MNRKEACIAVGDLITKDRSDTHGEAVDQLSHAAMVKNAVAHRSSPHLLSAEIEAIDMICTKLSRLAKGKPILDHYLDIIGYAAIAVEARSGADVVKPEFAKLDSAGVKGAVLIGREELKGK